MIKPKSFFRIFFNGDGNMAVEMDLKGDIDHIFRAYDVRGVYNTDLTPEVIARIGLTFGTLLGGKGAVTIGHDSRTSSKHLESVFSGALASTGVDVVRIGELPIPLANFETWSGDYVGGVYITASHNPAEYNGIRFRNPDGSGYTQKNQEIKELFFKGNFHYAPWDTLGRLIKYDNTVIIERYKDFIKDKIDIGKELKVALDPGNGTGALVAPYIFDELGQRVVTINAQVDGRFPGRESEPKEGTIDDLQRIVVSAKCDFGVAYDGDADRCRFVDDKGNIVQNEKIGILLARYIKDEVDASRHKIVANISCSMILEETLKNEDIDIIRVRVGDVYVCEEIKKHNAMMGLESSAHYFISKYYIFDDPIYASLIVAEVIAKEGRKLSELAAEIPSYPYYEFGYYAPDTEKFKIVEKIKTRCAEAGFKITTIDGIRVDYDDGWILLRPSNTEPKIRMFVEGHTEERAQELKKEYENMLFELGAKKR